MDCRTVPIVAQSYDGASVMSGHLTGVQQRIKEDYPFAIYVHCMAHKLNLVLVESCTVNRDIKMTLNVIDKLYSVFSETKQPPQVSGDAENTRDEGKGNWATQ